MGVLKDAVSLKEKGYATMGETALRVTVGTVVSVASCKLLVILGR